MVLTLHLGMMEIILIKQSIMAQILQNELCRDALHNASDHLPVYMDVWFDDFATSKVEVS